MVHVHVVIKINLPYQKLEGVFRDCWEIGEALPRLLTLCFPWKQWQPENCGATSLKCLKKKTINLEFRKYLNIKQHIYN